MFSRRNKVHELNDENHVDMTAMIDITFQLILFFMLTSGLGKANQIELDLPESTSAGKGQTESAMVVSYAMINGKPTISLNSKTVDNLDQLRAAMKETGADPNTKPRVDVRIEKNIPYSDVISVLDTVRGAGFPKFSLMTSAASAPPKQDGK
jgi:biopolymer transport protein ExbD